MVKTVASVELPIDEVLEIKQGDRIAQGMFCNYLVTVDDKPIKETRVGGFGSTN